MLMLSSTLYESLSFVFMSSMDLENENIYYFMYLVYRYVLNLVTISRAVECDGLAGEKPSFSLKGVFQVDYFRI